MTTENVQVREYTADLPVNATPDQVRENLQRLKVHTRRLQELKEQRRSKATEFNEAIKHEEGIIKDLNAQDEHQVRVPTRVREEKDYAEGIIRRIRLDTEEVFLERPMTDEERQMSAVPEEGQPPPEEKPKRGRGRPKGSKNKAREEAQAAPEGANGSGEQQEALPEGDDTAAAECACAAYFESPAGTTWDCPVCGPRIVNDFGEQLERREDGGAQA